YNKELEKYLNDSPSYVAGVKEALKKSGRLDWNEGFKKFESQVIEYDKFIKRKILPLARKTPQMPSEIYAHILKVRGIDKSPEWLIDTGKKDFDEVFKKFELVAQQVAKKRNWKYESPAQIIERLKQEQVTDPRKVQSLYENVAIKLTNIIKENNLVSLPKKPIKIRVAGDAESLAIPVPHLNQPPLVNNKGERPEFVVPTSKSGKLPFDDFSYGAAALVLTAHEGRPGHDLQFSEILDRGLSLARARYAVNNVNIEGWALYAEDLVYPYIPLESQLVAIQTRLWRIARMYLDPEVQLQKVASVDVIKLFNEKLGVSKVMAQLEYDRYAFRDVGQAPSYYYGLLKIRDAKSKAQEVLKEKFDLKCFNDSLLEYGLVPVDKISSRLILDWECH
ncbi:MAG: DUF885 family protein, partial [Bdellovibrionales bacterium]|nr:DUF885 family protein [Bdellovibrionales bacterium]